MTVSNFFTNFDNARVLMFTDIHVGARQNSELHNLDCLQYVDWLCELAAAERATHIAFLGDFFENRSSINVASLNVGTQIMRRLNKLGIPILFMVGNHDLYHRNTRRVFSTDGFKDLKNVLVISEPLELTKDVFVSPYLFKQEYLDMAEQINSHKYVFGHFEFRGFVVTGDTKVLEHGPDAGAFTGPKFIFSGHFHKRQVSNNVVYIGNTFPTNFGDAWDTERGAALLDMSSDDIVFFDYPDAPLFYKLRMSELLANQSLSFKKGGRVYCTLDMDVGYTDVQTIREEMIQAYDLREFSIEEDYTSKKELLTEGLDVDSLAVDLSMLHNTIGTLIREGVQQSPTIDPDFLISIFDELKLEK